MVGAVDQRHREIDHLEAERPVLERVGYALLDRGEVVARHRATGDLLVEGEARTARERLDVEHHVAELAVATRLLLVPATLRVDRLADGLAVADARRAPVDRDAVAIGKPLGHDAQMHLALAPHDDLVGLGIVMHDERGILVVQLVERHAELDVVLAVLGRDRDREHRREGRDLRDRGMDLLAGRQRVAAGPRVVELAERDSVAGHRGAALLGHLADQLEHARHGDRPPRSSS